MTAVDVDALDKLREAVLTIRQSYPSLPQLVQIETDVEAAWSDGGRSVLAECYGEDVAALIVAAVNALPELLAEVRRGRALREAVEGLAEQWLASSVLGLSALAGAGRELRRALAAVDGGER